MKNSSIFGVKIVALLGVLLGIVFCCFTAVPAYSQVTGATLAGTVTDASGAVIAGAAVSVKNTATGVSRDTTSDSAGLYTFPNLTAGDYEVRVAAKGFSTAQQSNVSLAVGQQQQLNFSLKVGESATTVEVTGSAPQVELTSSTLSDQVESQTVRELPLNGRDWTQLATLQPGVKRIETQMQAATSARGNRGFGGELTVSGQRSTFNNYRIDGISVVDYANAAPGSVTGAVLGVDAIQEFSVLTGGFPAEYGRATGGVVNAISKSGTNSFHGDAYDFLRNSALDSRDFITRSTGGTNPSFRQNQFGASAGGPIIKDKTFVFGDYEGLRESKGIVTPTSTFSNNARKGILVDPNNAGQNLPAHVGACPADTTLLDPAAAVCVNTYSQALLALWPVSTTGVSGDTAQFVQPGLQTVPENFFTFRVDHKLGSNDSLFGTYLYDDTDYTQPDGFLTVNTQSHTRRQTIAIEENHTFGSSFVNTARVGYNRDNVLNLFTPSAIVAAAGDTALGAIPGQHAPRLTVRGGITDFFGGVNSGSHYLHTWNSYQFYDDMFWTHGAHTFKFGGGIERIQYNEHTFQEPGGRYQFASPSNFLQGIPKSFEGSLVNLVDNPREFRQTILGFYAQDDWKMKSNLTLNLGIRYQPSTVLKDAQGRITNLANITDQSPVCGTQFSAPIPAQPGSACSSVGPYYSNATLRNFEPRLGFAWDPFRDGKTSVRGGFGMYDVDPIPGYFLLQQNQAAPFLIFKSTQNFSPASIQPGFLSAFAAQEGGAQLVNSTSSKLAMSTVEGRPHRSYVQEWNLNVQRQLTNSMTLSLGYVGTRGVHLMTRGDDGNMTQPTVVPGLGYQFPGTAAAQINPNLGTIRYIYWNAGANYNALNVNLEKKYASGFQFQVAYTYAKSLDDTSQTIAGDTFANDINSPWWFLPSAFYGPSSFNVSQTLSINGLYDIPTPKDWNGALKAVLGGWEVGGIVTMNSGTPTTPDVAGDPLGLGNGGADQFGPVVKLAGCNPVNGSTPGFASYINQSCYSLPFVQNSALGSLPFPCTAFPGDPAHGIPAPIAPAGETYCANLSPFNVGRNSITGPRFFNLDFSTMKNFPITKISETFKVQFRAEMFNLTNHSNFVPPQPGSGDGHSQLFNENGSPVTGLGSAFNQLASQPRQIQFALKVIW
ncbi:MAG: TonB-dependent receptor [Acidobacteriia bacterium]|nr:TonB-dependent receptor [Terriglobia bacterium]